MACRWGRTNFVGRRPSLRDGAEAGATPRDAGSRNREEEEERKRGAWTLAQLLLDRGSGVDAYGSDVVDHCIVASGLDGSLPLSEQPEDYVQKLHAALRAAPSLADAISSGTCGTPRLLLENDKFISFAPGVFLQHEAYDVREFSSFCEAVDEYFWDYN